MNAKGSAEKYVKPELSKVFVVSRNDEKTVHFFSPEQSRQGIAERSLQAFEATGWVCLGKHVRDQFNQVQQSGWDDFDGLVRALGARQVENWSWGSKRYGKGTSDGVHQSWSEGGHIRHDGPHASSGRPHADSGGVGRRRAE